NVGAERILGYSRAELLTMQFWEVVHPHFRELVQSRGMARQQGESPPTRSEFQILSKSGDVRWLECNATRIEVGGRYAVLGSAFDITERKHTEEALRQAEAKYHSIFQNAIEGIFQ